ncbi:MAG: L,D-transpeptidase [Solirubrobacteraceae bacterium]
MRWRAAILTGVVLAAGASHPPAAGARALIVKPTQAVAMLLTAHKVTAGPHAGRSSAATVPSSRPITGERTALPVTGEATAGSGARWLRVMLPGRPNGAEGWIEQRGTELTTTSWHLVVRRSTRQVLVYGHGRLVRTYSAIIGKPSTPTPPGRFFVEEGIQMLPGGVGAPYALALSARSNVLQEFDGGPGQIALHRLDNVGGQLGTAASHGCVRLSDSAVTWLAARIEPGVPVTIL